MENEKEVKVKFFSNFRDLAGTAVTHLEAGDAGDLLEKLVDRYEGLEDALMETGSGRKIKSGVTVMLNGRNVRFLDGLDTELSEGDTIAIFPPIGGG
jgi:molybdopterin synthase sulfur carrier subunit